MKTEIRGCLVVLSIPLLFVIAAVVFWNVYEGDVVLDDSYHCATKYKRTMGFPDDHRAIFGDGRFALLYGNSSEHGYYLDDRERNEATLWDIVKAKQTKNIVVLTCENGKKYILDLEAGTLDDGTPRREWLLDWRLMGGNHLL